MSDSICYLCKNENNELIDIVNMRHHREIDLGIENFQRKLYRCNRCGVFFNSHNHDLKTLYFEKYNASTYSNDLMSSYSMIMNLPDGRSDNKARVQRVIGYCKANNFIKPIVLDVGSGLCVFGGEMIKQGYECFCIDPSPISIHHALQNVGVKKAVEGTIYDWNIKEKVNLVIFNKVLEHLKYPIPVLKYAKKLLNHNGGVYLELPDGENALENGTAHDREEFFVEHYTIFNRKAIEYLSKVSGYKIVELEQIHEPSDKYTLYAFLVPA